MRWPRRGILIRLAIYVPLIAFLGWNACRTWQARRDAEEAAKNPPQTDPLEDKLEPHRRTITMPDGTKQDIYELTPEEAERLLGAPLPPPDDSKDAPAKAEAPAD